MAIKIDSKKFKNSTNPFFSRKACEMPFVANLYKKSSDRVFSFDQERKLFSFKKENKSIETLFLQGSRPEKKRL